MPFSSLVEKAMESKGKELLPKIQEVINALRQTRPSSPANTSENTPKTLAIDNTPANTPVEFDLSLPIDLPGMVSSTIKKEPGSSGTSESKTVKKEPGSSGASESKTVKKEPGSSGASESKTVKKEPGSSGTSESKTVKKEPGSSGASESKTVKKEPGSSGASESKTVKKEPGSSGASESKTVKKEPGSSGTSETKTAKESGSSGSSETKTSKEPGSSGTEAKTGRTKTKQTESLLKELKSTGAKAGGGGDGKSSAVKEVKCKEKEDFEKAVLTDDGNKEKEKTKGHRSKRNKEDSKNKSIPEKSKDAKVDVDVGNDGSCERKDHEQKTKICSTSSANNTTKTNYSTKKNELEKKQLPARRRSARLASLTEDQKNDSSDHDSDALVRDSDQEQSNETRQQRKLLGKKRSLSSKVRRASKQKRAKVYVNSSSEESENEIEENMFKSAKMATLDGAEDTKRPTEHKTTKRACPRKQSSKDNQEDETTPTLKRPRQASGNNSPTSLMAVTVELERIQQKTRPRRRKSINPKRISETRSSTSPLKSPPPAIVTRSNRHVKPNKHYYDSSEEQEETGNEGERSDFEVKETVSNDSSKEDE